MLFFEYLQFDEAEQLSQPGASWHDSALRTTVSVSEDEFGAVDSTHAARLDGADTASTLSYTNGGECSEGVIASVHNLGEQIGSLLKVLFVPSFFSICVLFNRLTFV